jgi:hypothetical protein
MTNGTSGPSYRPALAYYDPDECSWRMSGVMFPSDWPTFSETCPEWGMTLGGELYALPTPELLTAEPESSSLLPTPVVNDMGAGKTPEAWDAWTERMQAKHANGNGHGPSLSIEAQRLLLPTPTGRDHKGIRPQPAKPGLHLPEAIWELSTGGTFVLRSADGSPSWDDQPHDRLSLDETAAST